MNDSHIGKIILDESTIAKGVNLVADRLNADFSDAVIITVVPGGIFFTADLTRKLNFDVAMDYISCPHTPGERNNASEIVFHNNIGIEGRHVIVIDDAIESGGTMRRLVEHLNEKYHPQSVSVAVLFVKPGRVSIPARCYYAYEMENDDLLIGYGMPWQNKFRNLPCVSTLIKDS
ncbi:MULTISPECIES: phosphoribosyltransferase [Klebsiella pneumoniae complex]|uniref:Hypoxanthine-guanine phosphoribosyltransferase n=1 Tax=Klebsiella quasivariicola TaxID=2026240 RepID=A0A8B4TRP8_9ENTR|nr:MULTISPECIES: phosphoribosyltransferase family protein [Klebsiella]ASV19999.1 hypoxanthine phosphoribosyltransferase [Klebsiella quasivariicola]MBF7817948.1 hypoxanthine phosphoribosyltransferase [Klebsiella quasivariicola]MCJ1830144.1 hypoxanthine phosphoribosyltransferase [Klebsiella quasivariicola]SXD89810.1 hypoxanthine-guanine phosphoribosyltransferase [Klebsiella quasivariicola]